MFRRIAHTGIKQRLEAVCLRSAALALGVHRRKANLDRPIFIVGCGRSGTTIFGQSLGQHEDVGYLNEPRLLWQAAFPRSDVSSRFAHRVDGALVLDEDDWNSANANLLRFFFAREVQRKGKTRLCEKTPGNEFRLKLITKIFPEARYLWIVREGNGVARSIQKMADSARDGFGWYGFEDYKWRQIEKYCENTGLPFVCRDNFDRGLLEWRISIQVAADFFRHHPGLPMLQIRYEELTANPVAALKSACEFAELSHSRHLLRWAERNIKKGEAVRRLTRSGPVGDPDTLCLGRDLLRPAEEAVSRATGATLSGMPRLCR